MPVVGRLNWLERQVRAGRRGYITVGAACDPTKLKVKVSLQPARGMRSDPTVSEGLALGLQMVRNMLATHVAMDRGHQHTDGVSVVAIWLRKHDTYGVVGSEVANVEPVERPLHTMVSAVDSALVEPVERPLQTTVVNVTEQQVTEQQITEQPVTVGVAVVTESSLEPQIVMPHITGGSLFDTMVAFPPDFIPGTSRHASPPGTLVDELVAARRTIKRLEDQLAIERNVAGVDAVEHLIRRHLPAVVEVIEFDRWLREDGHYWRSVGTSELSFLLGMLVGWRD